MAGLPRPRGSNRNGKASNYNGWSRYASCYLLLQDVVASASFRVVTMTVELKHESRAPTRIRHVVIRPREAARMGGPVAAARHVRTGARTYGRSIA